MTTFLQFIRNLFKSEPDALRPETPPSPNMSTTTNQKLYDHAKKDIGLKETPGKASTPRIALAISLAAKWLDKDDSVTSWCGCLLGLWCIETGAGVPSEHYRAASWLKWGEPVPLNDPWGWKQGDVLVFKREGGYHVALLSSVLWVDDSKKSRPLKVNVLGGNQSNACNILSYPISMLVGVRRKG